VRAYLTRIEEFNPRLNAYITVIGDEAVSRARELQDELESGRWRGPLHGIPIALKDNIDTAGVRTTAAGGVYAERVPDDDAEVVRRLHDAGAIVLGKLNMHEFAFGDTSAVSYFGAVRNPWDLDRIPGGSSGGSAAAVAARLCAAALGTDTGGSIRLPAAYCGVVGLKPTYGLASIRGIIPLSVSLDHVGPMCRTVGDAALMLQYMAGYDPLDVASTQTDVPQYLSALRRTTSELKLGVADTYFYDDVDEQILSAVEEALDLLRHLTAGVQPVELPTSVTVEPIIFAEAYAYHAELVSTRGAQYQPLTLERIQAGAEVPASEYIDASQQLRVLRNTVDAIFQDVDLLITPTSARLPEAIETAAKETHGGVPINIRNTSPFNALGIPTITVICGFSRENLPIGLQIGGRAFGELDVLALAHAYEQATDWHTKEAVP
jgi:aspartyl-tRNA(Asn)/glutamyl-tRNA(Gln) amidotransferase subunit A